MWNSIPQETQQDNDSSTVPNHLESDLSYVNDDMHTQFSLEMTMEVLVQRSKIDESSERLFEIRTTTKREKNLQESKLRQFLAEGYQCQ